MNTVANQPHLMYFTTYITIKKIKIINTIDSLTITQTNEESIPEMGIRKIFHRRPHEYLSVLQVLRHWHGEINFIPANNITTQEVLPFFFLNSIYCSN